MLELNKLTTEARNPGTAGLDTMTPLEIATVMNREDEQVVAGVRKVLPEVAAAIDALEEACAGTSPLLLRSDGLGKFGRATDATLWLGIAAAPELEQLAARLRDELRARDVPFDAKPFKAHLTLARRARIPHVGLPHLAFPQDDEAYDVTLYKSTLDRAGAVYKPLHTVCLGTIAAERV